MHWFEKEYVFNEDSRFKGNIVFWKRVQFTLEIEKDNFLPFLDVGITKSEGKLIMTVY